MIELKQFLAAFGFLLFICLAANYIAWRNNFYQLTLPKESYTLSPKYPLIAFAIYLGSSLFIAPLLYLLLSYYRNQSLSLVEAIKTLPATYQALIQLFFIAWVFGALLLFLFYLPKPSLHYLFTGKSLSPHPFHHIFKNLLLGASTLLLSYPTVMAMSLLSAFLIKLLGHEKEVTQTAVEQLKKIRDFPLLFSVMGFFVIFVVPFIEELLFRGFLQSYFREKWGSWKAIFITAALFSIFHFSRKQAGSNIEIILSLSILGFYLGFLYEKQRNLWAPIGLHMAFNAISVAAIAIH